ncbi:hypothetical protein AC01_3783 [Escherichia coli 1-392-07_S3_C1]|uniref:Uncharacterized protein n=1 Tax=Escherichia coli (strain SMS-3-5 / SECEC) TaxID=439855 RepID=B1LP27_ECOSM|nr:hypothetical protein EcSMS35_1046 [Escherichia coli SMS-3-5]ASI50181.1 Hypothetical protein FORC43_1869 [Escherichia coli]EMV93455.1 hypothetical protein EC2860050_2332 [Escherichia coli 2860050]EMW68113.1 hypothetical protein EC2749250_2346 [Escherichia coli 2749250]EMZ84726.1 hypothetical protein ECP03052931_2410 [Escherichia coli p0305293.1]ENA94194.1 hypothetical protein EC2860650_2223 [Escherichia coli 2860650]ENC61419.1 hypothetical protein ECP02999175_2350 [Escherichia coli P0299917
MNIWLRFFYSFLSKSSLITICSNLENLVIGLHSTSHE